MSDNLETITGGELSCVNGGEGLGTALHGEAEHGAAVANMTAGAIDDEARHGKAVLDKTTQAMGNAMDRRVSATKMMLGNAVDHRVSVTRMMFGAYGDLWHRLMD